MPVPVSQTKAGPGLHITQQHNAVLASEGPFERAARMRAEREAAEAAGVASPQALPDGAQNKMPRTETPMPRRAPDEKIQGDAIIDVKGLNFSYPGLGELGLGC